MEESESLRLGDEQARVNKMNDVGNILRRIINLLINLLNDATLDLNQ